MHPDWMIDDQLPEPPSFAALLVTIFLLYVFAIGFVCFLFCKRYWRLIFIGVAVIGFLVAVQLFANNWMR